MDGIPEVGTRVFIPKYREWATVSRIETPQKIWLRCDNSIYELYARNDLLRHGFHAWLSWMNFVPVLKKWLIKQLEE